MKNTKTNVTFVVSVIVVSIALIAGYLYLSSRKPTPKAVSCAIGDKYDIMTGKPCPPSIEEPEPTTTVSQ